MIVVFIATLVIEARKVGTIQISFNWQMNKQKEVFPYPGIFVIIY